MNKLSNLIEWLVVAVLRMVIALTPGRLLGSLSWRVEKFVKHWRSESDDLRRNTWFEHLLLGAAAHPWKFLLTALVIWASIVVVPFLSAQYGRIAIPQKIWERSDLLTYFGTAWSVQATVVALVYPLVVSFVALLLQRRATAKVALTAFLLETGVKPSGTSSFVLLLLMTLQYLALPRLSEEQVQAAMVANLAWLAVNLFLTGWFLARTATYLQDDRRIQTMLWLTQCVTFPDEIQNYARGLLLQNAQQQGWLPDSDLADETSQPKVVVYPMGEGQPVIQVNFSKPKELRDVHFALLGRAVENWLKGQEVVEGEYPLLELPCTPDDADTTHVLCRVREGRVPRLVTRAAIRASYKFVKPRVSAMPFTSVEVMEELGLEAASMIELGREPGFGQALSDLVQVHSGLLNAARYRSNDGGLDSTCLLQEPYGWGARPMARAWMQPYRPIAEAAVASLERDVRYFSRASMISARLARRAGEQPHAVLIELLLSSTLLMYHLGQWWSRRMSSEPTLAGNPPRQLPAPLQKMYSDVFQGWVGSWEAIAVRAKRDTDKHGGELWNFNVTRAKVYAAHIDETARLLLNAAVQGDAEGARRLEDSLVKWWSGRRHEFGRDRGASQPAWNVLTLSLADLSWEQAKISIPELPSGEKTDSAAARLLALVLKQYWVDVCMVTALLLLEYAGDIAQPEESLCAEIIDALITGRGYDAGGTADIEPVHSAGAAVARLTRVQFSDKSYSQRLDRIVEQFSSDMRAPMTSGRCYSYSGADDVDSLTTGQALYLTALARPHDNLREFTRLVETWRDDLDRLNRISRHFTALEADISSRELRRCLGMLGKLRESFGRNGVVDDAIEQAAERCRQASDNASAAHAKAIEDAPLDPARLEQLARAVQSRLFSTEHDSEFPIALTTTFEASDDPLETMRQGFTGVSKLPFTNPQLEPLEDHNVRWFAQYVAGRMFAGAVAQLQRKHGLEAVRDDHADAFFADLDARIQKIISDGEIPIVLVADGGHVDYLSPYQIPEDSLAPAGIVIRPPGRAERGLHALVNGVAVYTVPMSSSRYLVLPGRWLEILRFNAQQDNLGFSVEAINEVGERVDLTFKFACEFVSPLV